MARDTIAAISMEQLAGSVLNHAKDASFHEGSSPVRAQVSLTGGAAAGTTHL